MLLIDTNVLIDVLEDDPVWAEWSLAQLRAQSQIHALAINPIVYAELSLAFNRIEELERIVENMQLEFLETPRPALFLAGKAFAQYKAAGGKRQNVLPDFFIGAHAAVANLPLLTRDAARYRTYYPSVQVIAPDSHKAKK
jgi:predicted nucleic acid-binding protein